MTTLWIGRQMADLDILQDACELIYFVDPDVVMYVGHERKHGSSRLRLTFCVETTEEAVAYVHGDLVQAGCVYVKESHDFIPIRAWVPSRDDLKLEPRGLHRAAGKGTDIRPAHPALAVGRGRLEQIAGPPASETTRVRHPNSGYDRSRSLRDIADD